MSGEKRVNLSPVAAHYAQSLKRYGAQSVGVGWTDPALHDLRFDKLMTVIEKGKERISVNDLGCGYGALYNYLIENGMSIESYRGYDISTEMLEQAREQLPEECVELFNSPCLDKHADYSIASGIFNVKFRETEKAWKEYINQTLHNMHEYSHMGFAFNLLSSYVDYREEHLFYGDPLFYFDYCKKEFSSYVSLLHDYPLYEWTIVVRK